MGRIDPKKEYELTTLAKLGVFPQKDLRTLRKIVQRDYWGENLLKAKIEGEGNGKRYQIKGANIIKFLERYGSGLALTVPKKVS